MFETLKDSIGDDKRKDPRRFIVCEHSPDGRHDYQPITDKTINARTISGKYVKINHFKASGLIHYREKCSFKNCAKVRMGSMKA